MALNADLSNLLTSFQMPMLILGNDLTIRRFSSLSERFFNVIPSDIGRPLSDISAKFPIPNLQQIISEVVETLQAQDHEITDAEGRWYLMRVQPYRTSDNQVDGAVLLFVGIDELRRALIDVTSIVGEPVLLLSPDLKIVQANPAFLDLFQLTPEATQNSLLFELAGGQWDLPQLRGLVERAQRNGPSTAEVRLEHDFPKIGRRKLLVTACRLSRQNGGAQLVLSFRELH